MFGTQDGQGLIVFHDAWLEPASLAEAMQMDVLTVHYPYYYRGQAAGLYDIEIMDPRPIPFISVKGRFWLPYLPSLINRRRCPGLSGPWSFCWKPWLSGV